MRRLAPFTIALLGSTALASAADIYVAPIYEEPPVSYAPSAFNWTGFYAGIHGGFGGDRFEYPFETPFGPPFTGQFDLTSSGFFAGGQIGANWQFAPQWVVGVEVDGAWSDIKGELGLEVDGLGSIEAGSKVNWFSTIRGRLGFLPTPRFMIYGTGGAAVGETESFIEISGLGSASTSDTEWGWTAGGGFEYAITDNITIKTEYLYVDLGSQTLLGGGGGPFLDVDTHFHTIKAGLNFLWGGAGGSGADLPYYPPVETAKAFDWTGLYAGIHGGYGGDRFEYPFEVDFFDPQISDITGQADLTSSGFFAGGQVGVNWQFAPRWVVGVEGDIAWSDIKGELGLDVDQVPGESEAGSKVNWFGTIRGRLGFLATPRFMVYGTGGAAYGETESYLDIDFLGVHLSKSETNWGWTAGGGFEYAITDHVTLKTEYLYVDLGEQDLLDFTFVGLPRGSFSLDAETHFHTIKAGLNFLW
jgi:outer membrane immunogenic protein